MLKPPDQKFKTSISGVINLTCSSFSGTISLCFQKDVFLKTYEALVGESHDSINDEVKDAAGELLNMIYGQAKTELNKKGYQLEKALPTVVAGEGLELHHGSENPVLVIDFDSRLGKFYLEVVLAS